MADLTTLERLRRYLGTDVTETTEDDLLADLISSASAWFEKQTGVSFGVVAHTDTELGDGSQAYMPRHYPIASVTSLSIDGAPIPEAETEADPGWYVDGGYVCLNDYTFTLGAPFELAYTAGEAVPADVAEAVTEYAALKFRARGRFGHTYTNVTGEDIVPDQGKSGPSFAAVMSVVNSYRRMSF